jgi:hypothetical protein
VGDRYLILILFVRKILPKVCAIPFLDDPALNRGPRFNETANYASFALPVRADSAKLV